MRYYIDIITECLNERAFHGSPHHFSHFSTDHIGTGEGAQAYGWGLYFSDRKEVADWYRKVLTAKEAMNLKPTRHIGEMPSKLEVEIMRDLNRVFKSDLSYKDNISTIPRFRNIFDFYNFPSQAKKLDDAYYTSNKEAIEKKIAEFQKQYKEDPDFRDRVHDMLGQDWKASWDHLRQPYTTAYLSATNELERQLRARGYTGALYSVEIPNEGSYLLWDMPVMDQPRKVKDAILKLLTTHNINVSKNMTGNNAYRAIENAVGSDKKASLALLASGIPGIKYLDGTSRGIGEGSYNYVVFDESSVNITE